jgi:dCTP deaminase
VSVLSSKSILSRLNTGRPDGITIAPILEQDEQIRLGQASVDVRLGSTFRLVQATAEDVIDTIISKRRPAITNRTFIPLGGNIILHPHQLLLGETLEFIRLPYNVMCYVMGRSSWARDGLLVATAVGVHPNYSGCVTLELRNLGEVPIRLYPGDLIAQLFLHEVSGVSGDDDNTPISQFAGGGGPRRGAHRYERTADKLARLARKHAQSPAIPTRAIGEDPGRGE